MVNKYVILVLAATPLLALAAPSEAVRIVQVEPTVLFLRGTPLRQVAWLDLLNEGTQKIACRIAVLVSGAAPPAEIAVALAPGLTRQRILAPDISAPSEPKPGSRSESGRSSL